MKNLLLFLITLLFAGVLHAQTPRDIDVIITYPAPIAGEQITNYDCSYTLQESGVLGVTAACDFTITNPLVPHVLSILGSTSDSVVVTLAACNSNGCSSQVVGNSVTIPPAVDPATPPAGFTASVIKL